MENTTISLVQILHRLLPDIEWVMNDDDLSTLVILTPNVENPTVEQVEAMRITILNEIENTKTQRQAALDKLAALGLEPDDLKALGL